MLVARSEYNNRSGNEFGPRLRCVSSVVISVRMQIRVDWLVAETARRSRILEACCLPRAAERIRAHASEDEAGRGPALQASPTMLSVFAAQCQLHPSIPRDRRC